MKGQATETQEAAEKNKKTQKPKAINHRSRRREKAWKPVTSCEKPQKQKPKTKPPESSRSIKNLQFLCRWTLFVDSLSSCLVPDIGVCLGGLFDVDEGAPFATTRELSARNKPEPSKTWKRSIAPVCIFSHPVLMQPNTGLAAHQTM